MTSESFAIGIAAMRRGAWAVIPAQMHHYAIARGNTIVQVSVEGPFALTYVRASDYPATATSW